MAASTRPLTPSRTSPYNTTVAPDTPVSIVSQSTYGNTLAPIAAATPNHRASTSPKSQKASPQYLPHSLTGAAALEDHRRLREQRERAEGARTSPNPNVTAVSSLLGQAQSPARFVPSTNEHIAQMAQKIQIPEHDQNDNVQTSPVSMSSMGSLDLTTAANASTTASIMAPSMPTLTENPFSSAEPNAPRPAVDAGVPGDSRAFTFPPPPADDPRNNPHRNMSLPNAGLNPARSGSTRRHKCPYCSTVFTRHHNLKSHLLTHSQEKPYECQQCQSRFRRLHDLKRHTKLHTGERPHECPKCGRKFARGDALARHNKGQGGCAGRRSSFGIDSEDPEGREHMDGVEYTEEPDLMDEEEPNRRRGSVPTGNRQDSAAYRAGPSTYPPPAINPHIRGGGIAPMYPSSGSASRDNSSPQTHGSSLASVQHFNAAGAPIFHQGVGVTESPKPISPGPPQSHRGSASGPSGYSYASSRGSAPQLPPLPQAMQMSHASMPPPGPGSQPGSLSSHSAHSGGSGSSRQEILGARTGTEEFWNHVRDMETRMNKMQEDHLATVARLQSDHSRLDNDYRTKINQLETENKSLRETQDTEMKQLKDELGSLRAKLEGSNRS